MTFDHWKTTNKDDERHVPPPCETKPRYDVADICMWCGADPTEACKWQNGND